MALIVGENTWATVAEADAYLADRVGTQNWFLLDESPAAPGEPSKESYLSMAFNYLINKGGYCLDKALTDDEVKYAQIEFAFYFVDNFTTFEDEANSQGKGTTSFQVSKWRESLGTNWVDDYALPFSVSTFLNKYICSNVTVHLTVED